MTIGSAIFLSALMIALAIIYSSTKDRWNWKKILKRASLIPVVLIVILALCWMYYAIDSKIENRAKKQIELEGVKLGDSKNDVIFKKGIPEKGSDEGTLKDLLLYSSYSSGLVSVVLNNNKVSLIDYQCTVNNGYKECPSYYRINGISFRASLKDLEDKLGKPSSIKCSTENLTFRIYSYKKYQTEYAIDKDGVFSISIFDSSHRDGSSLKECHKE